MAITLEHLTDFLDEQSWTYSVNEERGYISLRMNMKTVDSCTFIMDIIGGTTLLLYSIFPIKVPEERRFPVAEFLHRANYGLYHGNFELSFRDGEIRYKVTAMVAPDEELDSRVLDRLVGVGFSMVDRYAPGILSVLYGEGDPEKAIDRIENSDDDDDDEEESDD